MDVRTIGDGTRTAKRDTPLEDGIVFVVVLLRKELEGPPKPLQGLMNFVFGWMGERVGGICRKESGWFAENHFDSVLAELGAVLLELADHPAKGFIGGGGFRLGVGAADVRARAGEPDLAYY